MSIWSRVVNVFRGERVSREIAEELEAHIAEAVEQGRDPGEARRAVGSVLREGEKGREVLLIPWLDSLRADAVFGRRQLVKRKGASAAAILSLALAIGSCTAAFRLIDSLLLRPLPVDAPERLYVMRRNFTGPDGKISSGDSCAYPMFRQMRALVRDQAELIAVSNADHIDLTYGSDPEMEKAYQQYVSGWMFQAFGVHAAAGRVFAESDDLTPGAHPYAVLAYDYWTRRFGRDPRVVGRTFHTGGEVYQIVGVAEGPFIGTEPGTPTDIFIPTMMAGHNRIVRSDYLWFRTFVQLKPGVRLAPVREKLRAAFRGFLEETVKIYAGSPKREYDGYLGQTLSLEPAAAGVSGMQKEFGTPLAVLGALVALVLLIACANVANLLSGQAAAREREMALRVSIGAGPWRLVQLLLVECAWLALLAAVIGAAFAAWSAPFVLGRINPAGDPPRLALPADWRVLGFGLALAFGVTLLFGLAPALRAARVKPASALKGGDPSYGRLRLMHALIAVQSCFCFVVVFAAGLLAASSQRLSHQPTGFSSQRLLALETLTAKPQPAGLWEQVAEHLRAAPGVEAVSLSEWPLMTGESWNGFISVNGAPPGPVASYFLSVSPGWLELMKIPLLAGRDFRADDRLPGTAIVNREFARQFLAMENPTGRSFEVVSNEGQRVHYQIVGVAGNTRYQDMRQPVQPVAFFPFRADYSRGWFLVRTANPDPLALASALRRDVARARPGFRVSNVRTQAALVEQHTVRERLLAMLALFFAAVALLLAGVGLYGVLDYSVLQRRREIGIRMAVGAQSLDIARRVMAGAVAMVLAGAIAGLALGIAGTRYLEGLLYGVKGTDWGMLTLPSMTMLAAALLASVPALLRALGVDPAATLRSD
jgi:putative ABC transport system permease protein